MDETKAKVVDLDLNDILPNRFQPRIKFNEDSIIELSESIKEHGVIQPIIVRPIGDKYEIIAGERRYKASVLAGKDTIPAIISSFNDKDSAEVALIENVQRRDLTPIEEAISYKKILDMGYLTQEQLAVKLGRSQSAVANKIRLLNLCDEVQEALMEDKISERHARSLLKLKEKDKQKAMLDRIIKERLTVRKTEEEIEKMSTFITEPIDEPQGEVNTNAFSPENPGFMDVDKIQNQAQDILSDTKPDFNSLLMSQSSSVTPVPTVPSADMPSSMETGAMPQTPIVENPTVASNSMMNGAASIFGSSPIPGQTTVPPSSFVFNSNGVVVEEKPLNLQDLLATPTQRDAQAMENALNGQEPVVPMVEPVMPEPTVEVSPMDPVMPVPITETPSVEPAMPTPAMEVPTVEPVMPTPAIEVPSVEPAIPVPPIEVPSVEPVMPTPTIEVPSTPVAPTPSIPTAPVMPSIPAVPSMTTIPSTPIVEGSLPDAFVEPTTEEDDSTEVPGGVTIPSTPAPVDVATGDSLKEQKVDIQPIIITDYSKQYDPVLPESAKPVERVDFKKIIGLVRQLNDTIEKCGYSIDTEEYDLEDEYQVIIKINKN